MSVGFVSQAMYWKIEPASFEIHENFLFANCSSLPICCRSDADAFAIPVAYRVRISSCNDHAVGYGIVRATRRH
jgi:hypothetical protein